MAKYDKPLLDMEGTYHKDDGTNWVEVGTMFVEEDLDIPGRAPMSAMFLPTAFKPSSSVDVMLYLHGHGNSVNIQDYLRQYRLREIVEASGKNVVFIAPTLGRKSEAGLLVQPGVINTFLKEMMGFLFQYGPFPAVGSPPTIDTILLAAHSGGGLPMSDIAYNLANSTRNNPECWGFDCLYDDGMPVAAIDPWTVKDAAHQTAASTDDWERGVRNGIEGFWADWSQKGQRIFKAFWGGGGTLTRTANLQLYCLQKGIRNVKVEPSFYESSPPYKKLLGSPHPVSGHDFVPKTVLGRCLDMTTNLS